jgi:multiple sugar transport system permease protein
MRWLKTSSWSGWLFCLPWILGFLLLFAWPFLASLYWSFCRFDLLNPPEWIGWENYLRLMAEVGTDQGFGLALSNTLYYSLLSVPLSVALGVALAVLLSAKVRGQSVFRTLVFLPSVIPVVAASVLWLWLLDPADGMINYCLSWVGIPPQNWLTQARSAVSFEGAAVLTSTFNGQPLRLMGSKDALVMMTLWGVGNFVVIYLAAIGDIPQSLYEAAEIDGASSLRKFIHVTLPMLSPVIFFNLVMGLIRSVQTFASIYVLSEGTGQPGGSLMMLSLKLFLSAFADFEMGYASAMAWLLFVVLLVATAALFRTSRYWVHYRVAA